jgi:hypothetical protein
VCHCTCVTFDIMYFLIIYLKYTYVGELSDNVVTLEL